MGVFAKLLKFIANSGRAAQKGFTMASTAGAIALTAVLLATTSNSLLSLVKKESQINNANISKARMLLTAQALAVYKYPGSGAGEFTSYAGDEGGVAYVPVGDNVTTHTGMSSQSNYKANVPNIPGVPASDGWGNKLQYCVWGYANNDSSNKTDITGAMNDGSFAKLIGHHVGAGGSNYEDIKAHYIMALISAGPDGTIDTNCNTHIQECTSASSVDACTQKMATASGGAQNDDMVYAIPFFEWDMMARDAYVETSSLPMANSDEICDPDSEKLHWDGNDWSCLPIGNTADVTNILTCNDDGKVWDSSTETCTAVKELDHKTIQQYITAQTMFGSFLGGYAFEITPRGFGTGFAGFCPENKVWNGALCVTGSTQYKPYLFDSYQLLTAQSMDADYTNIDGYTAVYGSNYGTHGWIKIPIPTADQYAQSFMIGFNIERQHNYGSSSNEFYDKPGCASAPTGTHFHQYKELEIKYHGATSVNREYYIQPRVISSGVSGAYSAPRWNIRCSMQLRMTIPKNPSSGYTPYIYVRLPQRDKTGPAHFWKTEGHAYYIPTSSTGQVGIGYFGYWK